MHLKLTPATILELNSILKMVKEYHNLDHLPYNEDIITRVLTELMKDPLLGRIWQIHQEQQVIGYTLITFGFSIEYEGKNAFIDELFLMSDARGKGIGGQVLTLIKKAAQELGIKALHLEAERSNLRAISLYHKFGFKDPDRVLMTYWI